MRAVRSVNVTGCVCDRVCVQEREKFGDNVCAVRCRDRLVQRTLYSFPVTLMPNDIPKCMPSPHT